MSPQSHRSANAQSQSDQRTHTLASGHAPSRHDSARLTAIHSTPVTFVSTTEWSSSSRVDRRRCVKTISARKCQCNAHQTRRLATANRSRVSIRDRPRKIFLKSSLVVFSHTVCVHIGPNFFWDAGVPPRWDEAWLTPRNPIFQTCVGLKLIPADSTSYCRYV